MDAAAAPFGLALNPRFVSLSALPPGSSGRVIGVGGGAASPLSALERRLLEFGFVDGEQVEVLAEARPGRDPFVVRVGHTTLALRRREAQNVWVDLHRSGSDAPPHNALSGVSERVDLHHSGSDAPPHNALSGGSERVDLHHSGSDGVSERVDLHRSGSEPGSGRRA